MKNLNIHQRINCYAMLNRKGFKRFNIDKNMVFSHLSIFLNSLYASPFRKMHLILSGQNISHRTPYKTMVKNLTKRIAKFKTVPVPETYPEKDKYENTLYHLESKLSDNQYFLDCQKFNKIRVDTLAMKW